MGQRIIISEEEKRNIQRMYGLINEEEKECLEGDCQNGKGKLKTIWYTYEGDFKDGKFDGYGKFETINGYQNIYGYQQKKYEGEFKNGEFHGEGKLEKSEGTYEGGFANGKFHGKGAFTYPTGRVVKGTFENGELKAGTNIGCVEGDCHKGKGKEVREDGTTYEGEFSGGKLEGKGKLTLPNGKVHDGYFYENYFIGDVNSKIKDGILNRGWVLMKGSHKQESKIHGIQDAIRRIQAMIMDSMRDADGIFGPKTEDAVKKYQEHEKLKVDGKVGKETFKELIKYNKWPLDDGFFSE